MTLLQQLFEIGAKISGKVLSEFLNATHRKRLFQPEFAREVVKLIRTNCSVVEHTAEDRIATSHLAETRKIGYYDALLCCTLARCGVTLLLSEDLADGDTYGGLTILNPFNAVNAARINAALA